MISALKVERFKCHREQSLRFAPLTVLAGTNGSGKSSILQALLLMRACIESQHEFVELNGPYGLKLGEALDVLHRDSEPIEGIRLAVRDLKGLEYLFEFAVPDQRSRVLRLNRALDDETLPMKGAARTFTFLSADRLGPQETFSAHDLSPEQLNVGWRGDAVAQVLVDTEKVQASPALLYAVHDGEKSLSNIPRQTELWLSEIVRPILIQTEWLPGTNIVSLRFKEPGFTAEWTRPTNTGFGLSSALPIIVAGLTTNVGGMLIVENPEAHLHPRGQAAMGAFLGRVAGAGVQVVVETHSDHVLNGIRRAVAIDEVLRGGDVILHFFDDMPDDGSRNDSNVTSLDMRPNGDISAWPRRFFDQIEEDLAALARVRRKR